MLSLTHRNVLPGVSAGWSSPGPCHASEPGRMADPSHQRPHLPVIPLSGSRSPLASRECHCVMETLMASQCWTLSFPQIWWPIWRMGGLHDTGHVWARVNALSHSLFPSAHPPSWPRDRHLSCFSGAGVGGPGSTATPDLQTRHLGGRTDTVPSEPLSGWRWSSRP